MNTKKRYTWRAIAVTLAIITTMAFMPFTALAEYGSITDAPVSEGEATIVTELGGSVADSSFVYTGKAITPTVTVYDKNTGTLLIHNVDYTVDYYMNVNVGTAFAKITGLGSYASESYKVYYKIIPKRAIVKAGKAYKGAFTAKWSKVTTKMAKSRITGYQIQYSTSPDFEKATTYKYKGYSHTSKKFTKKSRKTTYYYRVRTYMTGKNGQTGKNSTYYSEWSPYKSVTTK